MDLFRPFFAAYRLNGAVRSDFRVCGGRKKGTDGNQGGGGKRRIKFGGCTANQTEILHLAARELGLAGRGYLGAAAHRLREIGAVNDADADAAGSRWRLEQRSWVLDDWDGAAFFFGLQCDSLIFNRPFSLWQDN